MTASSTSCHWPRQGCQLVRNCGTFVSRGYQRLDVRGKIIVAFVILFYICLTGFVIVITPNRIAQYLYDQAHLVAQARFGWAIFYAAIVVTCIPPMTAYTTVSILCGFAYGMPGFYVAAAGSLSGSVLVILLFRRIFKGYLRNLSDNNEKWQALEAVIRAKGLPLIILIRMSPMPPWAYSNALFSSILSVELWQFVIATAFTWPRLLMNVFIGSRIAALSDGEQRDRMDTETKVVNGVLIGGGIFLTLVASLAVYHLVRQQIRLQVEVPPEVGALAAEAIEDVDEGAPLLRDFASDA